MQTNSTFIQRYALTVFLILTPLLSLAIAFLIPLPVVAIALLLLLIPSGMAILLTALTKGGKGVVILLKKLIQWRIGLKWYAAALVVPIGIILAAGIVAYLMGWSPTVQIFTPEPSQLISNAILILLVAVLEELGWRGYALPELLAYRSPLISALIIGVARGALHIGIGVIDGRPWLPTFLVPIGASVVITWLFVRNRGSLAMAILFHFLLDFTPQFLLSGLTPAQGVWSQAIVVLFLACILGVVLGPSLRRSPTSEPEWRMQGK